MRRISIIQKDLAWCHAIRLFSLSCCRGSDKKISTISDEVKISGEKFKYPKRPLVQHLTSMLESTEEPWSRVKKAFRHDYEDMKSIVSGKSPPPIVEGADVLIVGGGIIGTSIAHALADRLPDAARIVVIEKDSPECSSSMSISTHGLYHQSSSRTYCEMAKYASEFYRKLPMTFGNPDISPMQTDFMPNNSLRLVTEDEAPILEDLSGLYDDLSWKHVLLSPESLKARFPWMTFDGVALGCLGLQNEGMFDQWKILKALRNRAEQRGVVFTQGEVFGFHFKDWSDFESPTHNGYVMKPCTAVVQTPKEQVQLHNFALLILAVGPETPKIVKMLDFRNYYNHRVPIEARKRYVYTVQCANGPGLETPFIMDPSGFRFRKFGLSDNFLIWKDPAPEDEPSCDNTDPDESYYKEKILPSLSNRVPAFVNAEVKSCKVGVIDENVWDGEMVIGGLPHFPNAFVVAGCGHNEFLFAPAVGRYLMEQIYYSETLTLDLSMFLLDRFEHELKLQRCKFSMDS